MNNRWMMRSPHSAMTNQTQPRSGIVRSSGSRRAKTAIPYLQVEEIPKPHREHVGGIRRSE